MSLYDTLTKNTATSVMAIIGGLVGGVGGVILAGGVGAGAAAGALGIAGSIAGIAAGAFAADKYTEFTTKKAPETPAEGVAPTPVGEVSQAKGIGDTAMNALQSAPAKALLTGLANTALNSGSSTGTGPGGVPLLKSDAGRII